MKKIVLFLLILICINFINAVEIGSNNAKGVNINIPSTPINYSLVNVNNSQFLQGYTPTNLPVCYYQFGSNSFSGTGDFNTTGYGYFQRVYGINSTYGISTAYLQRDGATGTGLSIGGGYLNLASGSSGISMYASQNISARGGIKRDNSDKIIDIFSPLRMNDIQVYMLCNTTNEGTFYYNKTSKLFYGCNSTTWNDLYYLGTSGSTYNETYDTYVRANYSNSSNFWDGTDSYNSTQFGVVGVTLNLLETYLTIFVNILMRQNDMHNHSILNLTGSDTQVCSGSDKVKNVTLQNGDLKIVCDTDQTGSGSDVGKVNATTTTCSGNDKISAYNNATGVFTCTTDQTGGSGSTQIDGDFNYSKEYTFFEPFMINNAIETGEVGIMNWNYVSAGTSAGASGVVASQGNHPGQLQLSSGTTAFGNVTLDLGNLMITDGSSGNITMEWMYNLSYANTIANNYTLIMGFGDNLGATVIPVDGVYFQHNVTSNTWYAVTSQNSLRIINTTTAVPNNATWNEMRINIINETTRSVAYFYLNETLVASQSINIPNGTARAFGPVFTLRKTGGTTAITLKLDYVYFRQRFTLVR